MQLLFINFAKKINERSYSTVFFTNYSTYEGEPLRLYRSPNDIRRDIYDIKEKIASCGNMLNIRGILTEALTEYAVGEPEKWIPAIKAIVDEADDTLELLKGLRENLDLLTAELEDTRCVLGM